MNGWGQNENPLPSPLPAVLFSFPQVLLFHTCSACVIGLYFCKSNDFFFAVRTIHVKASGKQSHHLNGNRKHKFSFLFQLNFPPKYDFVAYGIFRVCGQIRHMYV